LREDQKKQEAEEEAARKQREIDQAIKEKAEKTAYNKAKRNNTEQSWEDFLIAFPESQLLAEAQKNYNDLLNIRLEEEKRRHEEVESLQIEMERLANERELKSAADLHDKIWQQAENEQNIALYSNYLDRYPQGVNTPRAIEALGRLIQKEKDFNAWQEAGSQNSKTSFEKYLREFPQGLYALEANAAINNIQKTEDAVIHAKLWQQAKITNTTIVYQKYLNQYPHGEHANEAIKTLNELIQKEQDLSVWRKVKAQGTKTAYEAYLKEFPHGIYVDEANFALKPFLKEPLGPSITDMVFIKGVTFEMGDKANGPIHKVTLRSFYISKFQVTQADWRIIMGSNPADLTFKGCDQCPVEGVSWQDIQIFLAILNDKTGLKYRLPTEAEWEFAAQGGNKFNGQIYAGSNDPDEVAWYSANSNRKTHPVGQKKPNHLGLYDMSGNVSEWCADWYDDYPDRSQTDPLGPSTGFFRVGRGGAWSDVAADTAVRYRSYWFGSHMDPTLGFRLARTP
jgi:formylglycine-generating enzyme required for sulfatase activity